MDLFNDNGDPPTMDLNNQASLHQHVLPSGLKPKLDLIFSEVEQKLPDIDFELSDIDSESDEPIIFHQNLKSGVIEEDKDLDTSLSGESFLDLSFTQTEKKSYSDKNNEEISTSSKPLYDNDLAFELQQGGNGPVNSWSDIPGSKGQDNKTNSGGNEKQGGGNTVKSWSDVFQNNNEGSPINILENALRENENIPNRKVVSWGDIPQDNRVETGTNPLPEIRDVSFLSLNSLDDKGIRRQLDREKNRNKEKELATSMLPPSAPVLSTQALDNIDLDALLQSFETDNDQNQTEPRQAWALTADENKNRSSKVKKAEGLTLIQKLAQMSMEQYGEDLSGVDPSTGAKLSDKIPDNDAAVGLDKQTEDVDEESHDITQDLKAGGESVLNQPNKIGAKLSDKIPDNDAAVGLDKQTVDVDEESYDITRDLKAGGESVLNQPNKIEQKKKKNVSSCGTNTSDNQGPLKVLMARKPPLPPATLPPSEPINKDKPVLKGDKEPTVFIDLRNFEQIRQEQQKNIERVQQVLGIKAEQSARFETDEDSDEENVDDWRAQRQKYKQREVSRSSNRVYRDTPISHVQPQRVIPMADMVFKNRSEEQQRSVITPPTPDIEQVRQRLQEEKEKDKRQEIIRKLREQKENERQAKLRLQRRLEALRPTASINGKSDPAENTPTIFDMDSLYEPAPRSLPPVLSHDTDCVLLTINLSSNGEIVLHRGSSNKSVDTGSGLSASYTTLLTWLLSLVPQNYTYLQETSSPATISPWILPFYVIGLQQALIDGQLCLMVAVTPVEQFDSKYIPKNKKAKKSEGKGFLQHLTKYFSTNTLHSVCPWLQNMVSMEVGPGKSDSNTGYVYKPPLPNITKKPLSTFIHMNPDSQAASKVFNTSVGFFWQTIDSEEPLQDRDLHNRDVNYETQNTLSLIYKKIYQDPASMMGILNRVLQLGLDLSGVRLVYPTPEQINLPKTDNASAMSELDLLNNVGAVLSLCIRGTLARSIWLDAVGPSDPVLARKTDPNSLCALYGGDSRDECLLFCPRTPARVMTELSRWFGGRVPPGNVIDVGTPYTKKENLRVGSPKGKRTKKVIFSDSSESMDTDSRRPLATLTSTTKSEIFLVLSPLVPPKCFGIIIASCQRRGFQIVGIKRCRLSSKRASALGISGESVKAFCRGSAVEVYDEILGGHVDYHKPGLHEAVFPSTILQLQKENGCHHAASLIEDCMVQLSLQGIMSTLQKREGFQLESQHMLHAARYSDSLLTSLGGELSKCFDPEVQINPNYVIPKLYTNPELEQITVLLLLGHDILKTSGIFVGKILNMIPYSKAQQQLPFAEGLELLGMKWLPSLTTTQAKEITPFEVGNRLWKQSLHTLMTEPCMVLALRGVNAFEKLEQIIQPRPTSVQEDGFSHQDMLYARNAEEAYTFIRSFFTERELFSDPLSRPMLPYIPRFSVAHDIGESASESKKKPGSQPTYPFEESIFDIMLSGPRPFTTFLVIKPRAFKKHLTKILKKLTQEGFTIVGLKLLVLDEEKMKLIVPNDVGAEDQDKHRKYLASGPSLCLSVLRENAVKKLLELLGPEDAMSARRQSQFYWRGVFGVDAVYNGMFASRTFNDAVVHQKAFFPDGVCCEEMDILMAEQICCPAIDEEINLKHSTERNIKMHSMPECDPTDMIDSTHNLLQQTTCVVLTPLLMKKLGSHFGYVDVIEGLVAQGFVFVGARMVYFTQEQAEHFLCLIDAGNFHQVPLLMSGPSIILALQRDNAVLAFDTIIRESFSTETDQGRAVTDSLLHKYGKLILRPADTKQANNLLGYFFQQLVPESAVEITSIS